MLKGNRSIELRIAQINERVAAAKAQNLYMYIQPAEKVSGSRVVIEGKEMLQFSSYSYLDLLGHPKIEAAAKAAIDEFGTGTHGVRNLAGTTTLHVELEKTIAEFKGTDDAMAFSSGFMCNSSTIAALVGRNDIVISDKLNHASIVDGCLLSRAKFVRVEHDNMESLEKALAKVPENKSRLVIADAVFSMDGDILNLPEVVRLCNKYHALLMIDEAHSLGVLGETGHGIEEHFGMENVIDVKMGTLSKTIPSVGGYIAGNEELITYLKFSARGWIFSAALPPATVAASKAAFDVILEEPERITQLRRNVDYFLNRLKECGFNTLNSQTPVIPVIVGDDERAWLMSRIVQDNGIFILPIMPPVVPHKMSRLRVNVMSGHTMEDLDYTVNVLEKAGKEVGILK
ncbi:MAG: hypothetical protein B6242_09860 [Anaerolineaceae bacterium 4572_78]|nr:MAG: hypothetical protein B6242_09860 [Anaerolineaceae bacterium 4572_78]